MPSTSKKQHNFMAAVAKNPAFAKKAGVSQSVGKDFTKADKGLKFGTGGGPGITRGGQKQINKQQTRFGSVLGNEKNVPNINLNKYIGKKEGGMATMKHEDTKLDKKVVKKAVGMHDKQLHGGKKTNLSELNCGGRIASKGEHSVQKKAKQGAEMVKMARGGGIEIKGKTKGTMIKMCGGGMKGKK